MPLKQFWSQIKTVWRRASAENGKNCRETYLDADIAQVRVIIIVVAVLIGVFVVNDYLFLGFNVTFYELLVLRVVLIVYAALQLMYLSNLKDFKLYDKSLFIYLLVLVFGILLINLTRPENFVTDIIIVDIAVLVFYLIIPTRFIYQATEAAVFSVGEAILIMFTFNGFMEEGLLTALISMVFANFIAALSSLQLHSYRWRIYQNAVDLKEKERLAAIGQTAGMIGHDIRNPLQAITSEVYMAKLAIAESRVPEEGKKGAVDSINLIEEQTDYISKIVSDLQDYARPIKPEIKEVDLAKLVTSVFQTLRIPNKVTVKVNIEGGFPKVHTDLTLIRRALTNLANNAIQAMPEGGTLELAAHKEERQVIISVSDTGKGIPYEIKPKIFTPLMTTKAKGEGLGLAVVKRLVEALGGDVFFESEVDKGTKFTIILPLEE